MKSPTKIGENRFLGSISSSSIRTLLPRSISTKRKPSANPKSKTFRSYDENAPPVDPNIEGNNKDALQFTMQSSPKSLTSMSRISHLDGQVEDLASSEQCIQVQKTGRDTCVEETENSQLKVEERIVQASGRTNTVLDEILEEGEELGDQIRQLKEELIRTKSSGHKLDGSRSCYFARDSLNQLRASINRSLVLSCTKDDPEEREILNVDDHDVHELNKHIESFQSSADGNPRDSIQSSFATASCEADTMSEDEICSEETETEERFLEKHEHGNSKNNILVDADSSKLVPAGDIGSSGRGISVSVSHQSPILEEPPFSESPKIRNFRKSMAVSSTLRPSLKNVSESSNMGTMKDSEFKQFPGPIESLAASLQRGLQIMDHHQRSSISNRSSVSFSFEHLTLRSCAEADNPNDSVRELKKENAPEVGLPTPILCPSCQRKLDQDAEGGDDVTGEASAKEKHLKNMCTEQATKIEQLTRLLDQYKNKREQELVPAEEPRKLMKSNDGEDQTEVAKETYETKQVNEEFGKAHFDLSEKEALLKEIADLKSKLQPTKSTENLRSSLLLRSIQLKKSINNQNNPKDEELEKERQRWTEMESEWISLTDDLRLDIENQRRRAEDLEMKLKQEKKSTEELNDALHRAVLGHSRFIEEYTELQERYDELAEKHKVVMIGISDMRKAAAKAGAKGCHGKRFAKAFVTELSAIKAEKERERDQLKKENKSLKAQLRDTAEAVQAAGELLVRLREAEQAVSASEERFSVVQEENEKLKKQMEKIKSKHKTEMDTMRQYLAESRLPGSALQPWYKEEEFVTGHSNSVQYDDYDDDDQAWRAEFGAIYQEHHY